MNETLCLVDSNILIRWVQPSDPDYPVVEAALDTLAQQDVTLCYTSQNLAEFWNACTRPTIRNGYGLSPEETDRRTQFFEARLRLLPDSLLVHEEWRRLLVAYRVSVGGSARRGHFGRTTRTTLTLVAGAVIH
jgi:hypothetical protein